MMTEEAEDSSSPRRFTNASSPFVSSDNNNMIVDMVALQALASQKPTPLRLADMYKYAVETSNFGQRLRNAQFLYKEIPIRMAQRAMDLLTLPHGLNEVTAIRNVAGLYLRYLEWFQHIPMPSTVEEEDAFTDMLERIILDRTSVPSMIARGIQSWQRESDDKEMSEDQWHEMEDGLYRFFTARVGLRFLTEHHILSSPSRQAQAQHMIEGKEDFLGCIMTDCDPVHEVKKVVEEVTQKTLQQYGVSPKIEVLDSTSADQKNAAFTYVPHHLQYMVAELLKNSCRATVMRYQSSTEIPPIKVVVVKGAEDVSIKIADQGGGAPRSTMEKIWNFAHSTKSEDAISEQVSESSARGFGLPLARIYARYFGGELTLRSMEGYGVDAYLYLPRLGHACENLPASVVASPGEQDSNVVADMKKLVGDRPIVVSRAPQSDEAEAEAAVKDEPPQEVPCCTGALDLMQRKQAF
jgi:pyruvate dehydrogenase kinase 2/3/4